MSAKPSIVAAVFTAVCGFGVSVAPAITIPTVPIGNPGNAADPTTGYGSVAYAYNIGATEVTNAQYAAFLNAVASTDTNALFHGSMAGQYGGITRSGSSGSYNYITVGGRENNPVTFVSFWDAARFANWLHNGQPTGEQTAGTTEDGAYTLTPGGISANTVMRNANWQWGVTNENEWYKAAYHQPASQGGDADNYWLFPTSGNSITTTQANYGFSNLNTMPAGSYAPNFYGTYDMGGNVWEWVETTLSDNSGTFRKLWGDSWFSGSESSLRADSNGSSNDPTGSGNIYGFRVSQIPAPSSASLITICAIGALRRRHASLV